MRPRLQAELATRFITERLQTSFLGIESSGYKVSLYAMDVAQQPVRVDKNGIPAADTGTVTRPVKRVMGYTWQQASAPAQSTALVVAPPAVEAAVAVPSAAPPPGVPLLNDEQIFAYCRKRIVPRTDCARCVVARTDVSARERYTYEGGHGPPRRVCDLFAHSVSKRSLGDLLDGRVPLLAPKGTGRDKRRKKVIEFMQNEFGVAPIGKKKSGYKVTLYTRDASGALVATGSDGQPSPHGSKLPQHYDMFMGFQIVADDADGVP